MKKLNTIKFCAGLIVAAFTLIGAPKAEATLVGNVFIDGGGANLLGTAGGAAPQSFNFTTTIAGINFQGGANSFYLPGPPQTGNLFDSTTSVVNTTGVNHTLHFVFTDNSFTLGPNPFTSQVDSNSSSTGTSGANSLNLFSAVVAGSTLTHTGLPLALTNIAQANNKSQLVNFAGGVFTMTQDFTFTLGANGAFNFSNSIQAPGPAPVPEPGNFIAGAGIIALIGGSQLLSRKRNRQLAC